MPLAGATPLGRFTEVVREAEDRSVRMTADHAGDWDELPNLIGIAERVVGRTAGGRVRIGEPVVLTDPDRRNRIVRWAVLEAPTGVPARVILK